VCDLETSRIGAPYIYNVRLLRVKANVLYYIATYSGAWISRTVTQINSIHYVIMCPT
jgi:hypothetical protein